MWNSTRKLTIYKINDTKKYIFVLIAFLCAFTACQGLVVEDLRSEMLEEPLAIDSTSSHFSWKIDAVKDGVTQTAFQILVATEPGKLNEQYTGSILTLVHL